MKRDLLTAVRLYVALSVLTGIFYPAGITVVSGLLFPDASAGSFIVDDGRTIGSALVGQEFSRQEYFWPRPSAIGYEPLPSGGSNACPTSRAFSDSVRVRQRRLITLNRLPPSAAVPKELYAASASGIDPHIGPAAARIQVSRVAEARGLDERARYQLAALVERFVEPRQWGILGQERVNVLLLNVTVDRLFGQRAEVREPDSLR